MCHSTHLPIKDSVTRLSYDTALDVDVCDNQRETKLRRMLFVYEILDCTGSGQRAWRKG
jgi:hypothetical protein